MANLLVRGVEDGIVQALKKRAGAHGRSGEAEHRATLRLLLSNSLVRQAFVAAGFTEQLQQGRLRAGAAIR